MTEKPVNARIFALAPQFLPEKRSPGASGGDVRARIDAPVTLFPRQMKRIPLGFHVQLPLGAELQVRPRSGLAMSHLVTIINSPGTVDADYRGEVGALMINHGDAPLTINPGDRIAQVVIQWVPTTEWHSVGTLDELTTTERGTDGFGSTGVA